MDITQNEPLLLIPVSLAQGIGNYLAQKPWAEVHQAMEALQALKPAPVPEPVAQPEPAAPADPAEPTS